jgi:prepilin-type N-terminal cleavage/methylation domain-containing protein/prepilin-type processing-associated H-X9-DG protein
MDPNNQVEKTARQSRSGTCRDAFHRVPLFGPDAFQGRGGTRPNPISSRLVRAGQIRSPGGLHGAFTLIELLAAIAIIGLVASLLLPGLVRSKDSAQRIRCLSNLRQLGLATHLYWDDNGGSCFRYGGSSTNGGQLYWFGWFGPGAEGQRAFDPTQSALYPYLRGRGVELCPAFNYFLPQVKLKASGATYGYGYNLFLSAAQPDPAVNVSRLKQPSITALLADAAQVNTWQAPASKTNPMLEEWYYIDNSTNQPNGHFRHHQRANVEFCDGHVAPEKPVPGSLDARMPNQFVGLYRLEILQLP